MHTTVARDIRMRTSRDFVNWDTPQMLQYGDGAEDLELYTNCIQKYYRAGDVVLRRYAVRIDGFFSWHCGFNPGKVVTKPIIFQGNSLRLNFATSALGYVRVRLLDESGNPIDGYDSGNHFGDSLDRPVAFEKSLRDLNGKPVRLEFSLKDAEFYSFQFA